jgi:hypothetical protein
MTDAASHATKWDEQATHMEVVVATKWVSVIERKDIKLDRT